MDEQKYTLKVGTAERYEDLDAGETRLRVPFQILSGEEVVLERNESFALGTPQEDIVDTLKRHLEVFTAERAREAESKEHQAQLDQADEVAGEISNITIE
jgi:hypothetical protein